jgi:small nuclear ribonucleoprotein (snRNP)-like protein
LLGRVRAFDSHFNMVLEGVREMWTTEDIVRYDKRTPKPGHRDRFLRKMFLRGDSVIIVVKIDGQTLKGDTSHPDNDKKNPVTIPSLAMSNKEVGGEMMTEPRGYM